MNAKIAVFVICVEEIIYFLLYNLHNYTFNVCLPQALVCPCRITPPTCDTLPGLVPFLQFSKREKDPWRSVNCSKVAG